MSVSTGAVVAICIVVSVCLVACLIGVFLALCLRPGLLGPLLVGKMPTATTTTTRTVVVKKTSRTHHHHHHHHRSKKRSATTTATSRRATPAPAAASTAAPVATTPRPAPATPPTPTPTTTAPAAGGDGIVQPVTYGTRPLPANAAAMLELAEPLEGRGLVREALSNDAYYNERFGPILGETVVDIPALLPPRRRPSPYGARFPQSQASPPRPPREPALSGYIEALDEGEEGELGYDPYEFGYADTEPYPGPSGSGGPGPGDFGEEPYEVLESNRAFRPFRSNSGRHVRRPTSVQQLQVDRPAFYQ